MVASSDHSSRLFRICCIALTVTAMTFAVRAGILSSLGEEFALSDSQLGWINAMAFLGFPVATILGGGIYNLIGAKQLILLAFICHLLGLLLTLSADGFWGLLISTFFIGFANGAVESGCNPLIAETYHTNKTTMLNRFHVWFPGGIVIGALLSKVMTDTGLEWEHQIEMILIPTFLYGILAIKETFPVPEKIRVSTAKNIKAMFSPLFVFMVFCMTLTATTELGTQQWVERVLGSSGASPMLIMALITGVMAVGRYFAGPVVHTLNPVGVLLVSALASSIGIYSLSVTTGVSVYLSAVVFALGVTYFWPTMLGFVAEKIPESGALGLAVMGGAGMLAVSLWNPVIGHWIDSARNHAVSQGATDVELAAGQAVLSNLVLFPLILVLAFAILLILTRASSNDTTRLKTVNTN